MPKNNTFSRLDDDRPKIKKLQKIARLNATTTNIYAKHLMIAKKEKYISPHVYRIFTNSNFVVNELHSQIISISSKFLRAHSQKILLFVLSFIVAVLIMNFGEVFDCNPPEKKVLFHFLLLAKFDAV